MRAVVTAGGTSEPIDDVRVVTNLSTGRFGAALANALAERGVEVELLAGRALATHPEWVDPRVRITPFGGVSDLDRVLSAAIATPPELLLMAAAVSDYSPVPAEGKIRSDADELHLVLRRVPKLLPTLRERCGPGTFLVGFKLLSNVPREELVAVARRQVAANRLDLCVANDLRDLRGDAHPLVLVTPEGGAIEESGTKAEVARRVVDLALKRRASRRFRGLHDPAHVPDPHGRVEAAALAGLAVGGSASHRSSRGLWISGGGEPEPVHVEVDPDARVVRRGVAREPSVDAPVHALLYRSFPELSGLVRLREGLALDAVDTTSPWPGGTSDEAEQVTGALLRAAMDGRFDGGGFVARGADGGLLVGVTSARRLEAEWVGARDAYREHLRGIGVDPALAEISPLFERERVIGVTARFEVEGTSGWSVWLDPTFRRGGRGERVADLLDARGRFALVGDACAVLDWYAERGWRLEERRGPFAMLRPPSRRDDLVPAASACLVDPLSGRVLIGRRKTPPFLGWWAFPGGKLHPGEAALDGALRELAEETGVRPCLVEVLGTLDVFVGDRPGYRVTNLQLAVAGAAPASDSDELEPRWVPLEEARALRPMAAGTRRILRRIRLPG